MFENVQFFSHLHFKIAKSAIMTQKKFFLKNINMGIKKTQNFMLISNLLMRRGSVMVRRGSVGSASACCKVGPSSILGSAPQGGLPH
jgi:hypothetical protein